MTGREICTMRRVPKRDETGASAVEYGLLVVAIAAIIVLLVFTLGGYVKQQFQTTCDRFASGTNVGSSTC